MSPPAFDTSSLPQTREEWSTVWRSCKTADDIIRVLDETEAEMLRREGYRPTRRSGEMDLYEMRTSLADEGRLWTVALLRHMRRICRPEEYLLLTANPSLGALQRSWILETTMRSNPQFFNKALLLLSRLPGPHWPLGADMVARMDAALSLITSKRDRQDESEKLSDELSRTYIDALLDTTHRGASGEEQRLQILNAGASYNQQFKYYSGREEETSVAIGISQHLNAQEALRIWKEWPTPGLWWSAANISDVTDVFAHPEVRRLALAGFPMAASERDQHSHDAMLAFACLCAPGEAAPDTDAALARLLQFRSALWVAKRALDLKARPRMNPAAWRAINETGVNLMGEIAATGTAEERAWAILNVGTYDTAAAADPVETGSRIRR